MTRGSVTARPCPSCRAPKPAAFYLCTGCWGQLPPATRRALNRRDTHAYARLRALHTHISSGRPLTELEITR